MGARCAFAAAKSRVATLIVQVTNKPAERVGARHVRPSRGNEPALEFRDWLVPIPDTITYESKDGVLETLCLFARASRARFFSRGLGRPFSFFSLRDQPTGELVFLDYEVPMLEQQEELLIYRTLSSKVGTLDQTDCHGQ